jgi:glutaredoxin
MSDYFVTVYTNTGCGPCTATKAYLRKYGIGFTEENAADNPLVRDALIDQGFQQFPVVLYDIPGIGSGSWSGHESEKLEELKWLIRGEAE